MAGPGGGPPRKSHTKSRKGCGTCKKRHIRCDEQFPQCRNCTKHNCRCDYMDSPHPPEEAPKPSHGPNLLWTSEIEREVGKWQSTWKFPFPDIRLHNYEQFLGRPREELRLIHHLCSIYRQVQESGMLQCTPWIEKIPLFLDMAEGHNFVMNAILALSATHLAWLTKSPETTNLAFYHRGNALNGLQAAIGTFSQVNSDPILAASILLSWQVSDWPAWTSIMQGVSSVLSYMVPWKHSSRLAAFVEEHVLLRSSQPQFNGLSIALLGEDDTSVSEVIQALEELRMYFQNDSSHRHRINEIIVLAQTIQVSSATMRHEQLFDTLQSLRSWLLFLPITLAQRSRTTSDMLVVAHLYAAALAVDSSFPELLGAALGALVCGSIEEIDRQIRHSQQGSRSHRGQLSKVEEMMQYPAQLASKVRYQRAGARPSDVIAPGQQSPHGFQNLQLGSAPSTPGYPTNYTAYTNYSSEDLSLPPSPFLSAYPTARPSRHSQGYESSPRPSSIHSFGGQPSYHFSPRGDSPSYSPAYSPAPQFEDEQGFMFGEPSSGPSYAGLGGFVAPAVWT